MDLNTPDDAFSLLASLGASERLVRHHGLVVEAARLIEHGCRRLPGRGEPDWRRVLLGAALHDAGKIEHPSELSGPGSAHEPAGEALLRARGVEAELARCCRTHARWSDPDAGLEDRLVALADKLWKGKRDADLEGAVCAMLAALRGVDRWALFVPLDTLCERVAAGASDRLERS